MLYHKVLWICFAIVILPAPSLVYGQETDQDQLSQLLTRLDLVDLKIVHLQEIIKSENSPRKRIGYGRELRDSYIQAILDSSNDPQRFEEYITGISKLIAAIPDTNSASTQVMILQAKYLRAETAFTQWLEKPTDREQLKGVKRALTPVVVEFKKQRTEIEKQVDLLSAEESVDDPAIERLRNQQISQLTQVQFRATYFSGWSNYYLAVANDDPAEAKRLFTDARDCFAELLGVDPKLDYRSEISAEWIELHSIWIARVLLGLGVSETGLRKPERSKQCFDLLAHPAVPASLRTQAGYWNIQSWLNIGEFAQAKKIGRQLLHKNSTMDPDQRTSICVSFLKTAAAHGMDTKEFQEIGELGLVGLMKLQKFQQATRLVDKHQLKFNNPRDFYLMWFAGYQLFLKAEKNKNTSDYKLAAEAFVQALNLKGSSDSSSVALCRYHNAWATFRLKQYSETQQLLSQALPVLKVVNSENAQKAAWLRYDALQSLAKADASYKKQANAALHEIVNEFPGTEIAKSAEYQLARMKRSTSTPSEIIKGLTSVDRENPNYISARFEMCQLYYQLWQEGLKSGNSPKAAKQKVYDSVTFFLQEAQDKHHQRKLRATLIATDVAMRSVPEELKNAEKYLRIASKIEPNISSNSASLIEFHYRKFQLAQKQDNSQASNKETQWLSKNGQGTAYQKSALIDIAKTLDQKLVQASGVDRTENLRAAVTVYKQMTDLFGVSEDALKKNKNSRVILSRLISYETELRMFNNAIEHSELLLKVFPDDAGYLRKNALAYFGARRFEKSLPAWRKLVKGLKANSEPWYEAKYHLMYSLSRTDPESAKSVYQQFRTLHPDIQQPWKSKVLEIGIQLNMKD